MILIKAILMVSNKIISMKKLSICLFLILFGFSAPSFADDIRDFQIEGMSVGDSALDFFSEKHILKEFEIGKNEYSWTDQKFTDVYKYGGMELYDNLNVAVKRKDKKYIIYTVTGQITYDNINDCLEKQKELENEFTTILGDKNKIKHEKKHSQDKTGKSKVYFVIFEFETMDKIEIACFDLAKHMKQPSGLDVGIISAEYRNWIQSF